MARSLFHHELARSPLGNALKYYIQNGMAPNVLHRLTLHLCYWYQSVTGRQTTALDGHIYRRTRTTLRELRYAYTLWQRHRYPCRCGCEANNTDLGAFSSIVNRMCDQGWLGEDSEDVLSTDGYGDVPTQFGGQRREEPMNSRSRSSPPDPPTEQRNSAAVLLTDSARLGERIAHRASNARESWRDLLSTILNDGGHSRNISTTPLMRQTVGSSDASWSGLIWRARRSSNISSRTSRRSRDSSRSGRGIRRSPDLGTALRRGRGSQAPSTSHTRRTSGALDSIIPERVTQHLSDEQLTERFRERLRLIEQLTIIAGTEGFHLSATVRQLLVQWAAGPQTHDDRQTAIDSFWFRITRLVNRVRAYNAGRR